MAYATQADLLNHLTEQELIELTDDAQTGAIDAAKVTAAIEEADGLIDSYCRGRYTLPLVVSKQVRKLSIDIVLYYLFQRRRTIPDSIRQAYEDAVSLLQKVSSGAAALDQPPSSTQSTELDVVKKDREDEPRVFEDSQMEGF